MRTKTPHRGPLAWLLPALLLALAVSISGCATARAPAGAKLVEVPESDWPLLLDDMDAASLEEACRESLDYLGRIPPTRVFRFNGYKVSAGKMIQAVKRLGELRAQYEDPHELTEAIKSEFRLFKSVGSDGEGRVLFTGYYEPVMHATRAPRPPYVHPLYAMPEDVVYINLRDFSPNLPKKRLVAQVKGKRVIPYHDREAIDFAQALKDKASVLAYLSDPVEAFFLHIQGSGQVVFPDGERLRLGYAGTNGRPYRSIGRYLLKEGLMERHGMSMQGIRRFLAENPELKRRVLSHNPSYVFFRPLPAMGGPLGCYEQPLTAGRSVATDRRIFPGLAPAYIMGARPGIGGGEVPLSRFVLNQDTGGAIRGPGRLDLFFGSGYEAGELAGRMKHVGELYFLAPR